MGAGWWSIFIEHYLCKALARMKRSQYLGRCVVTESDARVDKITQRLYRHGGEFCDNGSIVRVGVSHRVGRWLLPKSYGIGFR